MINNPVPWPNGAKCAVAITFDMDADSLIHLEHPGDGIRRLAAISLLRYGPEVGIPRILASYKRLDIQQTFFVPAWCIENYPKVIQSMVDGGHEVAHHGYLHENPLNSTRKEERYWLQRGIEVGWRDGERQWN